MDKYDEILKGLTATMHKMLSLYDLYNSCLVSAESERGNISTYFDQLVDCKNDLHAITADLSILKKSERVEAFSRYKSKIARIDREVDNAHKEFNSSCKTYDNALSACGSLKTEYKHEYKTLKDSFKAIHDENTPRDAIKGYNQQVKRIRAILDKIEELVSDYNVKRNKMKQDSQRFNTMYDNVNMMIDRIQTIA